MISDKGRRAGRQGKGVMEEGGEGNNGGGRGGE